ncbi:hypothetical protein AALP_AA8G347600 [Arabis alpina]|uniref:DUF4283 domain-containing protein n=1 Tax=Arabis alpina TaxID=50452 RepID=A0A087GBD8_ARAAL|nr:hypothetical protein AALP_AA8G347600 [Arabis alpina]
MGHRKSKKPSPSKRRSPPKQKSLSKSRTSVSETSLLSPVPVSLATVELADTNPISPCEVHDGTVSPSTFVSPSLVDKQIEETVTPEIVAAVVAADPELTREAPVTGEVEDTTITPEKVVLETPASNLAEANHSAQKPMESWCSLVKGSAKPLSKKGEAFTLPSGEACVQIPNSVIEKHRKSWDCFVLGQFYSDPPSQGTIYNIVNGIWSKQFRDISVSKMEGNSFLFRIPNRVTRNRVITQRLWQIEGQTMFVASWEPGVNPVKPELASAPIWLELRKVPFQFFNEDGLERIAGLVGEPKQLHPSTSNKTNPEVAKVLTIIDPRKPLPEAVNAQFESGEIFRVLVSSPWMPPVCDLCKEIGHSVKRCQAAPKLCKICKSVCNGEAKCKRAKSAEPKGKKTRRGRSLSKVWVEKPTQPQTKTPTSSVKASVIDKTSHGFPGIFEEGEASARGRPQKEPPPKLISLERNSNNTSEAEVDSSDISSSDHDEEDVGKFLVEIKSSTTKPLIRQAGTAGTRGKSPKL